MHVVQIVEFGDRWGLSTSVRLRTRVEWTTCPNILIRGYLYLGAFAQERTLVRPWSRDRRRSRHRYISARRKAPVRPTFINDAGIVDPRNIARARRRVRVVHLSEGIGSVILRNGRRQTQVEEQRQKSREGEEGGDAHGFEE